MDLGESIRKQVQEAVEAALRAAPKNVTTAATSSSSSSSSSVTSVSSSGHSVSVYVDDEVTIVERDGKRRVIRHDEDDEEDAGPGRNAGPEDAGPGGNAGPGAASAE